MNAPKKQFKTIDEYIGIFPKNVQDILEKMRQTIRKAAPEAEETISYQIPTFRLHGNLVYFAGFKNHIGFYPTSSAIEAFKKELSPYAGGKGSVKFPMDEPIPLGLVMKIVKYRAEENWKRKKEERNRKSNLPPKRWAFLGLVAEFHSIIASK